MLKKYIFCLLMLAVFAACKSTTNALDGQQLLIITSDRDTTSIQQGPVTFTLTVLQPSGYGVSGAYIDFYDPIEQRARHEGPTPEDGTWQFTDTVSVALGGSNFEFAFVAEGAGAVTSDSLRLWVQTVNVLPWIIDSIEAQSWDGQGIGVQWSRPTIDTGTDTIFVHPANGSSPFTQLALYPNNTAFFLIGGDGADTITVHNAVVSSKPIVWAPAIYNDYGLELYENGDSDNGENSGLDLAGGEIFQTNYYSGEQIYTDLIVATDPTNTASGISIISPSVASLSGFSGGRVTAFYHPIQYVDNGTNLRELFYGNDLSTYVKGVTPIYKIPLPDSSQYSTAFIAVTQDGHYAQVSVGPVMHDDLNYRSVFLAYSYQPITGLPYAGRGRKR